MRGWLFDELVRLQEDWSAKEAEARGCKPGSMERVSADQAMEAYNEFKWKAARDFRIGMQAAADNKLAIEEITRKVAAEIWDRLNIEGIRAENNAAVQKATEVRHEMESLRREVVQMRRTIP